ncbi:MAG: class I SAM-dependent methyltransferase [Thermoleophilia bacterium]
MGFFNWSAPLFHRFLDDRWSAEDVATLAGLLRAWVPEGGSLLDLGGGTGGLAARLAGALHAEVTILDPTPEMLARVPAHPALTVRLGVAEAAPFPDGSFDAVLVSDAFHHFRDLDRSVAEMVRVTRPGGGLLILEIDPSGWRRLIVLVERLVGEPANFFTRDAFCAFMAGRGVQGRCFDHDSMSYLFAGEVTHDAAARPGDGATG